MSNNKVLSKIGELNLQNERSKQDLDKQFPESQKKEAWIYELTRFDDSTVPFIANTADNTINIAGFVEVAHSKMYFESEFKSLFTESGSQLQITDGRNVYGYIKEDLDYVSKSYFVTFEEMFDDTDLKAVFMIDNNNQYDESNSPVIERIQLKPMVQELSLSNKARWKLMKTQDIGDTGILTKVSVRFKTPEVGLNQIEIASGGRALWGSTKETYIPVPVVPISVAGNSVNAYSPWLDPYISLTTHLRYLLFRWSSIEYRMGDLAKVFKNIVSLSHMVSTGFAGVEEEGFTPGNPSVKVTPSAGWYWKGRLENKEPKAIAAEIQSLIDLNMQASLSGQLYGEIDSNNVNGNIFNVTAAITVENWKMFFATLSSMYPQVFSNYTPEYGGSFSADSILPFKLTINHSDFSKTNDGSEIYKLNDTFEFTKTTNLGPKLLGSVRTIEMGDTKITPWYYEGNFNSRGAGELYVIDYQYAEAISSSSSTGALRNAQNRMITSKGAVAIGKPNDWKFVNNSGWTQNVSGKVQIPQSVFENMANPVFFYAMTEGEINDYYNEGRTFKNYNSAEFRGGYGFNSFDRGYPKVPHAAQIKASMGTTSVVEYFFELNSQIRDDAGGNNDYKLVLQNFDVKLQDTPNNGTGVYNPMTTGVNIQSVPDGILASVRPNASLTASNIGKTFGENSAAIYAAPKVYIRNDDIESLIQTWTNNDDENHNIGLARNPYNSLNKMLGDMTNYIPQTYIYDLYDEGEKSLTAIKLSTLGSGAFELDFSWVKTVFHSDTVLAKYDMTIGSANARTNIFSNNLFVDTDEDYLNTYTLINFGEK